MTPEQVAAPPIRLRAGEWEVLPCHRRDVVHLVEMYHYSRSTSNTATYSHGLYLRAEGVLSHAWGGALWIPPTRTAAEATVIDGPHDWRQVLALSRLVVHPDAPSNAASFLLGGSMRLIDRTRWPVLVTYADTRLGHSGGIYKATNWREVGPVPAGDVWIGPNGEQRGRKRGGKTLTADEMRALGFERAPVAPKIKFVHEAVPA